MRNPLIYFNHRFIVVILILLGCSPSNIYSFNLLEDTDEIDIWDLTFEESVLYPSVPSKISNEIKQNISREYSFLKKEGYNVKLVRNDDVILISIPIDYLFKVNSNEKILSSGERYLNPLLRYVRIKEMYRMLFCVHHDNTLDNTMADNITNERVLTLVDWMTLKNNNGKNIIPYSMGCDYPIALNSTKEGQNKNRRLDIYILPGKTMIDLALDNKL